MPPPKFCPKMLLRKEDFLKPSTENLKSFKKDGFGPFFPMLDGQTDVIVLSTDLMVIFFFFCCAVFICGISRKELEHRIRTATLG